MPSLHKVAVPNHLEAPRREIAMADANWSMGLPIWGQKKAPGRCRGPSLN
jgi:hypothetical protein